MPAILPFLRAHFKHAKGYPVSTSKDSPNVSKSDQMTLFHISENASKNGKAAYKGGRKLRCAQRFELWRSTERLSLMKITGRLHDRALKFGINEQNLLKALYRLEEGKHKPPTWLVLLLMQTYQIEFPWEDFHD